MSQKKRQVINDFISSYTKEYYFFHEIAKKSSSLIENALDGAGIKAIVSFRAKSVKSLSDKVEKRNLDPNKKPYDSCDEIYEDIIDLAGVRVALYFPSDILSVSKLIERDFEVIESRDFPHAKERSNDGSYEKKFDGYHAKHFRVKIKDDSNFSRHIIEIQIASVLMHAWSEVEHDLIYKPSNGSLSLEELMILDEINGMVISGNIALERLHLAMVKRVSESNYIFQDHFDLAAFISSKIKDGEIVKTRAIYELLKSIGVITKEKVLSILDVVEQRLETSDLRRKEKTEFNDETYSAVYTTRYIELLILYTICKQYGQCVLQSMSEKYISFEDEYLNKLIIWESFYYIQEPQVSQAFKILNKLSSPNLYEREIFDLDKFDQFLTSKNKNISAEEAKQALENLILSLKPCFTKNLTDADINNVYSHAKTVYEKVGIKA